MNKVYLVGSSGYLGGKLRQHLQKDYSLCCLGRDTVCRLDLNLPQYFDYSMLDRDTVLFAAAISSPDLCAADYGQAFQVNVEGTGSFIEEAIKRECRVLFFSSDAVYGFYDGIADENTVTTGQTAYGKMKKEIEDRFLGSPLFKSLRLSYVFSTEDKYTSYLLDCAEKGITAEVYHPFYRSAISVADVIDTVRWLITHWWKFEHPFLNLCGSELVSRVRIADTVKQQIAPGLLYQIIVPEGDFYKNRPAVLEMNSLYLDQIIDVQERFTQKVKKIIAMEERKQWLKKH